MLYILFVLLDYLVVIVVVVEDWVEEGVPYIALYTPPTTPFIPGWTHQLTASSLFFMTHQLYRRSPSQHHSPGSNPRLPVGQTPNDEVIVHG